MEDGLTDYLLAVVLPTNITRQGKEYIWLKLLASPLITRTEGQPYVSDSKSP